MKRLTIAEQKRLLNALPLHTKKEITCQCNRMSGSGIDSIVNKVQKYLYPVVKGVSKAALKAFILPLIEKKTKDKYEQLKKRYMGEGLKLAGQGTRKRRK